MKMLEGSYFDIETSVKDGETYVVGIKLRGDHKVYQGHFPGKPVSPGVCSIEMIRECTEKILNKELMISAIGQCRFITVLTPEHEASKSGMLRIAITPTETEEGVKVVASINDGAETTFVTYKGEYVVKN